MKKVILLSLCLLLSLSLIACSTPAPAASTPAPVNEPAAEQPAQPAAPAPEPVPPVEEPEQPVTLSFMLNSPELTEYYNDMAQAYNEFTNGRVTIDMTILQNDYQTVLKSRLNSGDIPDMFMSSAYNDNKVFKDYSYDLTNEAFMSSIDPNVLSSVTLDGRITGYPFVLQSHAFIYNKKVFADNGITELPTTIAELDAVCQKLQAAGIQPFATGFAEWWVLPQTTYPAMATAYNGDYAKLFADIESGALKFGDLPEIDQALDLLDLIKKYGGKKPMESSFDMQVSMLANGEAAMAHQGNWAEDSIRKANADVDLGYILHPTLNGKPVLAVESNLTFRIAKDSPNLQETLKWLEWITTSDYGKQWIPEKIKQMSPQKGAAMPDSMLARETAKYLADGQTCPWWIFNGPDGIEQPFGEAFQTYASGKYTRDQLKAELTNLIQKAFEAQQ